MIHMPCSISEFPLIESNDFNFDFVFDLMGDLFNEFNNFASFNYFSH